MKTGLHHEIMVAIFLPVATKAYVPKKTNYKQKIRVDMNFKPFRNAEKQQSQKNEMIVATGAAHPTICTKSLRPLKKLGAASADESA